MMRKDLAKMHNVKFVNPDDEAAKHVNYIIEITESVQFTQMQIYLANFKYEKALALIDQIYNDHSEQIGEPNTLIFILKQKYQI